MIQIYWRKYKNADSFADISLTTIIDTEDTFRQKFSLYEIMSFTPQVCKCSKYHSKISIPALTTVV